MDIEPTPRLLIYIPSYGRPAELDVQLARLQPQLGRHADRARVLVSDNATPGPEYARLRARYEPAGVGFRRNGVNLGGNANITMGFAFAEPAEHLWILSDDDPVAPDALDFLLPRLTGGRDLVVMRPDVTEEQDVDYDWKSGWSEPLMTRTGLISAVVFNVAAMAPYVQQAFSHLGTSFPHLAVVLAKAKAEGKVRFRLLPEKFHYNAQGKGDYSISLTGFPQLASLMPRDAGERFCRGWLEEYRAAFIANSARQPLNFAATIALMKSYGGALRERAEEVERAAAGHDPDRAAAGNVLASTEDGLRIGAMAEVAALLEAHEPRLRAQPDYAVARARWLHASGRGPEATALLAEVRAEHPAHAAALDALAGMAWEEGRRGEALRLLTEALGQAPLQKRCVRSSTLMLPPIGLAEDARTICAAYLADHPGDPDVHGWLGRLEAPELARATISEGRS